MISVSVLTFIPLVLNNWLVHCWSVSGFDSSPVSVLLCSLISSGFGHWGLFSWVLEHLGSACLVCIWWCWWDSELHEVNGLFVDVIQLPSVLVLLHWVEDRIIGYCIQVKWWWFWRWDLFAANLICLARYNLVENSAYCAVLPRSGSNWWDSRCT